MRLKHGERCVLISASLPCRCELCRRVCSCAVLSRRLCSLLSAVLRLRLRRLAFGRQRAAQSTEGQPNQRDAEERRRTGGRKEGHRGEEGRGSHPAPAVRSTGVLCSLLSTGLVRSLAGAGGSLRSLCFAAAIVHCLETDTPSRRPTRSLANPGVVWSRPPRLHSRALSPSCTSFTGPLQEQQSQQPQQPESHLGRNPLARAFASPQQLCLPR